jgi:organic hydroperoxide reductase OsmC/OhrA
MIKYPILFHSDVNSLSGINSIWTIKSQNISNSCAIPEEFEGPGGALSPEDLYAQALTNCFVATFKVFAEKSKLEFESVSCKGELIVDLDEHKKPCMKSFKLRAQIKNANSVDKAKLLAEKAFKTGFILNSVKTELSFELVLI